MEARRIARWPLAAALLLTSVAPAEAQFDRLRRKVEERVERAVAREAEGRLPAQPDEAVLLITPETLDRLARALSAEAEKREEVAAVLAGLPARRQALLTGQAAAAAEVREWHACKEGVEGRPEWEEREAGIEARAKEMAEGAEAGRVDVQTLTRLAAEMQTAQMSFVSDLAAAVAGECGPQPDGPTLDSLPDESKLRAAPLAAALAAGEFADREYAVLKERILPFCAAGLPADDDVSIPGKDNRFYVYARDEAQALAPRCAELGALLRAVL